MNNLQDKCSCLVSCPPARPVGRRREQRSGGGEVDGDSATKIMPSGSPAVATSNLLCYYCKITIVLIESKKNQTSHFVVHATNACLPGPRMETPVAVASTLAILTTVTAVARCKILTLPMPAAHRTQTAKVQHSTIPNDERNVSVYLAGRAIPSLAQPSPVRIRDRLSARILSIREKFKL